MFQVQFENDMQDTWINDDGLEKEGKVYGGKYNLYICSSSEARTHSGEKAQDIERTF